MSWDRLEASAWLAAGPADGGGDEADGSESGVDSGRETKAVLMQGGTGDSEVRRRINQYVYMCIL